METENIRKDSMKAWLLAARPKTLTAAAVPVMIGLALAFVDAGDYLPTDAQGRPFNGWAALLCLLFAFVMQIDANFINDFFDYVRGTDDATTRLGPRRACAQGWVSLSAAMKKAIALTTCLACVIGLPLVWFGGLEMIAVGLLCILFCFLYTTHLSYIGMGDILVLVFFGVIPVCIPYYIELHTITWEVRDNDRLAGKITLVVEIGPENALALYLMTGVVACLMGLSYWWHGHLLAFLLPLVYLVLHVFTYLRIKRIYQGKALNACLGDTARNIFIYGLTVAIGILLL